MCNNANHIIIACNARTVNRELCMLFSTHASLTYEFTWTKPACAINQTNTQNWTASSNNSKCGRRVTACNHANNKRWPVDGRWENPSTNDVWHNGAHKTHPIRMRNAMVLLATVDRTNTVNYNRIYTRHLATEKRAYHQQHITYKYSCKCDGFDETEETPPTRHSETFTFH